jgi:hypothetical protein
VKYRFGLRLHALDGIEHADGTVQHAQGALHFHCEVDVPGRVQHVNARAAPRQSDGGRFDGDAAPPLLLFEVGGGVAGINVAQVVDALAIEQHTLSGGGFAGVDVRDHSDVADGRQPLALGATQTRQKCLLRNIRGTRGWCG